MNSLLSFFFLLLPTVLLSACTRDANHDDLICGMPESVEVISDVIVKNKKTIREITEVMKSCPNDIVIARLLYSTYIREGGCEAAFDLIATHGKNGSMVLFPRSDLYDVFLCFYYNEDYIGAVNFYKNHITSPEGGVMVREAYAWALFELGDKSSAIKELKNVDAIGVLNFLDEVEVASYEASLLSLAKMLFSNGELREAAVVARRFLSHRPGDPEGYEVLLAAAVWADGNIDFNIRLLYCEIKSIRPFWLANGRDEVLADLLDLEDIIKRNTGESADGLCDN